MADNTKIAVTSFLVTLLLNILLDSLSTSSSLMCHMYPSIITFQQTKSLSPIPSNILCTLQIPCFGATRNHRHQCENFPLRHWHPVEDGMCGAKTTTVCVHVEQGDGNVRIHLDRKFDRVGVDGKANIQWGCWRVILKHYGGGRWSGRGRERGRAGGSKGRGSGSEGRGGRQRERERVDGGKEEEDAGVRVWWRKMERVDGEVEGGLGALKLKVEDWMLVVPRMEDGGMEMKEVEGVRMVDRRVLNWSRDRGRWLWKEAAMGKDID